jgi:hypothetical protein
MRIKEAEYKKRLSPNNLVACWGITSFALMDVTTIFFINYIYLFTLVLLFPNTTYFTLSKAKSKTIPKIPAATSCPAPTDNIIRTIG